MIKIKNILLVAVSALFLIAMVGKQMLIKQQTLPSYLTLNNTAVSDYFPKTVTEINTLTDNAISHAQKALDQLLAIPDEQRTFANTAIAFDRAGSYQFAIVDAILGTLFYLSPDKAIRDAAHEAMLRMSEFSVDAFGHNIAVYNAFKAYVNGNATKEQLTEKQKYFLTELMDDFKHNGLDLPEDKRKQIQQLSKELAALSMKFSENINATNKQIEVTKDELAGLDDDFINALEKTTEGKFILKTDYPTYQQVIEYCSISETRKKLYHLFVNRAYPENVPVLQEIIAKRDQLAKILGFESYADYNLVNEMVKNPKRADEFLRDLLAKGLKKENEEFKKLKNELPEGINLNPDNKFYPWDKTFVSSQYKKKHYQLDDREVSEYFPMEHTVKGLMNIYEQFFNISITELPISNLWDPQVSLLEVRDKKNDDLLGLLLLDLFPRPNKYSHACQITIIPALIDQTSKRHPALAVVIANFAKSTPTKPSLLEIHNVRTFFHEFGHAIHTILGATDMASTSGTHVKTDFVEMPSQMLEEWLWDADIIKMLSHHYKTGNKLPNSLIKAIMDLKNFSSGAWLNRQAFYSLLSLQLFGPGEKKDIDALQKKLHELSRPNDMLDEQNHDYASFGHLMGYGARYYSYLWSKVFAVDLFYYIKNFGLLNPQIGTKYASIILGNGGSVDPNTLLEEFLGRKPSIDAFIKDMGLTAQP